MKKIYLFCLLCCLLSCMLTGCLDPVVESLTKAEKTEKTEKTEAKTQDIREGERTDDMPEYCSLLDGKLRVLLDANATTGYEWTYFIDDENVLICEKEEYVPDETEEDICGSGGTYVADFIPKSDGTVTLKLTYGRPWENCFAKRMFVDVTVQDGQIVSVKNNADCQ